MYLNSGKHEIKELNKQNGMLTLDDHSKWKVSPYHITALSAWQVDDEVMVAANVGSKSNITHSVRNETIEATYLG